MASLFPLAPAPGQTYKISGNNYEYNATLGWIRQTSNIVTPSAPSTFLRGTDQFTSGPFTFKQVYDNIFDAYANNTGVLRNPNNAGAGGWNTTSYATTLWGGMRMLNVGKNGSGITCATVTVPASAVGGLLWLRIINDGTYSITRENTIRYRGLGSGNAGRAYYGTYTAANQFNPRFSPYSGIGDNGGEMSENHLWVPLVLPDGATTIELEFMTGYNTPDAWLSGLAFTDNPRGLGITTAIMLHRQGDGPFYANNNSFQWYGAISGQPCSKFSGRYGDGAATATTNNNSGPKKFALQCDINGNDKRVLFATYNANLLRAVHPGHLKAKNGTWIAPEECKTDMDWVSAHLRSKNLNFCHYWIYDIPAAEIAAAATVNASGGTLNNAVDFQMYKDANTEVVIANVFTYDI